MQTTLTLDELQARWPLKFVAKIQNKDTFFAYRIGGTIHIPSRNAWADLNNPEGMPTYLVGVIAHEIDHYARELNGDGKWTRGSAALEVMRMATPKHRAARGISAYATQVRVLHLLGDVDSAKRIAGHAPDAMKNYGPLVGSKYDDDCRRAVNRAFEEAESGKVRIGDAWFAKYRVR